MSFVYWVPNAGGDWDTPSNWSGGVLPGSSDVVTISTSTYQIITHSTGNDAVASLTVGNDLFDMTGGSLYVSGAVAFTDGFTQTGGAFIGGGSIAVTGATQLLGGYLAGNALLQDTGTITLSNYTIFGNAELVNGTVVNETGNVALAGNGTSISNLAGGVFDIATGNISLYDNGGSVSGFLNAGTLEMTASNVTSSIKAYLSSTGTISVVATGNLEIDGLSNTISGSITGAGQVSFAAGSSTIAAGTILSIGGLGVYNNGTSVRLAGAETITGNLILLNGNATLSLGGNVVVDGSYTQNDATFLELGAATLTLEGSATFSQYYGSPTVAGTGTLATKGVTTLSPGGAPALILGGSVTWANFGTVTQDQSITVGEGTSFAASIQNESGAVFDLAGSNVTISNGSSMISRFTNAGVLEATAASGTEHVDTGLSSTGTVSAAAGSTLEIDGASNTLSGTIGGAGQVIFGAGTSTISAGTTISVAALFIDNNGASVSFAAAEVITGNLNLLYGSSTLTLGNNVTVDGSYSQNDNSILQLGARTLTIKGLATFSQYYNSPIVSGTGTLVTRGPTTLAPNDPTALVIGGSVTWANYGTVTANSDFTIGNDPSVGATVNNEAGAVFDIAVGNYVLSNGSGPTSMFINAGTLEMTATNNVTGTVVTNVSSTGTISAVLGSNLQLNGPVNTVSGALAGTGTITFGGGTCTVARGTAIGVTVLAIDNSASVSFAGAETIGGSLDLINGNATLALGGTVVVDGSYTQTYGTFLELGAYTLTVDGNATFTQYNGSPMITGTGTLVTRGTTTLSPGGNPPLTIGGSVTWANYGTVNQDQSFIVGAVGGSAATLVNEASGLFDMAYGNIAIGNGSAPFSSFVNDGILETTAVNYTNHVDTELTSTGTLSAVTGAVLEIDGPSNTISGAIGGTGAVAFGGGSSTLASGTIVSVGTLEEYYNGTSLTLAGNIMASGSFSMGWGSILNLSTYTLTLTGSASFYQYSQTPTISGTGTLMTGGSTSIGGGGSPALIVGGSVTWDNTGTITQSQNFQLGNSNATFVTLSNEAGATFDIIGGNISIANNNSGASPNAPYSVLANAGLLEMTAVSTADRIYADLTNTGTVSVALGDNLELDGLANTLAGTITGAGQLSLNTPNYQPYNNAVGTDTTLAAGAVISVASFNLYGTLTTLGLAGNVTISSAFNDSNETILALGGHTLTLTGTATFDQYSHTPLLSGPGTLATRGATIIGGGGTGLIVGSGAAWNNYGTVTDNQVVQIGTTSTAAATVTNEAHAVFALAVNGVALNGSTPVSSFVNAGTLEATTTGTTYVNVALTNSGTVLGQTGNLDVTMAVAGSGLLEIGTGGTLSFTSSVASTETLKFLGSSGLLNLTLPTPTSFSAEITNFTAGDTIDLMGIANDTETFAGGVLTFTNSSNQTVAELNFLGSPTFTFASDGHGGTLVTTQPDAHLLQSTPSNF